MNPPETNSAQSTRRPARLGWGVAVLLVLLIWAVAVVMRGGGEVVHLTGWQDGLEAGQAKAAELDRPMLVMFTADWCGPCQILKRKVLNQPEVKDKLQADFVPVIVDMTDQSSANPNRTVAMRYGVSKIPTLVVLSSDSQEIGRIKRANDPHVETVDAFLNWLDAVEQ